MAHNFQEIMELVGIEYCSNIVGNTRDGWGVIGDQFIFSVMNNEDFGHDIFHYYSSKVNPIEQRNWVTEEGIAYLWGNAYYTNITNGEMAEQKELIGVLKKHLASHPETGFYQLFINNFWSDTSGIYDHLAPDFKVGRALSGVICKEVERIHGAEGIRLLITCGNEPDRFTAFFGMTKKLINLYMDNFNKVVSKLLSDNY